ncbi:ankyrin repeat domain-containing protein [soil metagenome]
MERLYVLFVLCSFNNLIGMELPNKKYDEYATQKLIKIIETSHIQDESARSVRSLIKKGADVNATSSSGKNCLWVAIALRDKPLLHCLLHKGINVNQEDEQGRTPLTFAISNSVVEFLKILIAAGADVNHQGASRFDSRNTPLIHALRLGYKIRLTIVDMLLRADADLFLQDESGSTVLHRAVWQADPRMVSRFFNFNHCGILLINVKDHNGFSPLDIAHRTNNPQILSLLKPCFQKLK